MLDRGFCNNAGCRFAHNEEELRATHGFYKMKMCGFARTGRCKHGEACRFAHSTEELRPMKPPKKEAPEDMLSAAKTRFDAPSPDSQYCEASLRQRPPVADSWQRTPPTQLGAAAPQSRSLPWLRDQQPTSPA